MSILNDILRSLRETNNLYSLDLETTGINNKARIWSYGFTDGKKGQELFFQDAISDVPDLLGSPEEDLYKAHLWNGGASFAERQKEAGAFRPFAQAISEGRGSTFAEAIFSLNKTLRERPGVILIQNAAFENKRFMDALRWHNSLPQALANDLQFVMGRSENASLINVSEEILLGRSTLREAISKGEGIQEAAKGFSDIMAKDIKEKVLKGHSTVIDLMDLLTLYQIDLVSKGELSQDLINYGRNMELLAKTMLGETEQHTALSDATQQIKVLDAILEGKTGSYVKALQENTDNHYDLTFLSQIRNRLQEKKKIDEEVFKGVINTSLEYYSKAPETNVDRGLLASSLIDTYTKEGEKGVHTLIDEYAKNISSLKLSAPPPPAEEPKGVPKGRFVAGALVGAAVLSTLLAPDRKKPAEESYNTLYEGGDIQLGEGYADWKERNNAHRSIY